MRHLIPLGLVLSICSNANSQYTIPDPAFAAKLQQIVPNAMNGNVLDTGHLEVTSLTSMSTGAYSGITNVDGLQFFTGLLYFDCVDNAVTNMPDLPMTLLELDIDGNNMTSLPDLPVGLRKLDCDDNRLTSLPDLPMSLEELECRSNQLTSLPDLPVNLLELHCSANTQLTNLPILPDGLVELNCGFCNLSSLPDLPGSLEKFLCSSNHLSSLPNLPANLVQLSCFQNDLTNLPDLPSSLRYLYCYNNQLTSLPDLPLSLEWIYCYSNDLECLPLLPPLLDVLKCYDNNIDCLPNIPVNLPPYGHFSTLSHSTLDFVPILCQPNSGCYPASITGSIFNDTNGNGQQDAGEGPFLNGVAQASPGNYLSGVDATGAYGIPVQPGSYQVQGQPVLHHTITTPVYNVTIIGGQSDTANHIGYQAIPGIRDLVVEIDAGVTRPGFDNNLYLQVKNVGTESTTASINLDFDAAQTWVGANVTPTTQTGNNATWSISMAPGDCWNARVTLNTTVSVSLGAAVQHTLSATSSVADQTPGDNTAQWNDVVVGSYDPNDKLTSVSSLTETEVQSNTWIDYTIRFQNTGTFEAENVLITDTLGGDLQWGSFTYVSASHPNCWYLEEGVLHVAFDHIQLPDSNANEPESHGFVKFRLLADPTLQVGDEILNVANIYFDFNEPVITDPNIIPIVPEDILLAARTFLGGCYEQGSSLMRDDLRAAQLIPSTEPYEALGYVPTGPQPVNAIHGNVLAVTGSNAIVDWVIVELRATSNNAQVVASRYGLIQRDGDIVDLDGTSPLSFAASADNYYIAIRHRNHLGILSGLYTAVGPSPGSMDLTYPQEPTYGMEARQNVNGVMVMWAGDVSFDQQIKYTGADNDRDPILVEIGGSVLTTITSGYRSQDVNMDGLIQYTGLGNDRDPILVNIGGVVPTAVRDEQMP